MPGFEPGASHMRSERSTTELHPLVSAYIYLILSCSSYIDIVCFRWFSIIVLASIGVQRRLNSLARIEVVSATLNIYHVFLSSILTQISFQCITLGLLFSHVSEVRDKRSQERHFSQSYTPQALSLE